VGPQATLACGGAYNWDCVVNANGSISFTGAAGTQFIADYYDVTSGSGPIANIVKVAGSTSSTTNGVTTVTANSWVTCTTCHDQHDMSYFNTTGTTYKPTHFFVRGWYDPGNSATATVRRSSAVPAMVASRMKCTDRSFQQPNAIPVWGEGRPSPPNLAFNEPFQ